MFSVRENLIQWAAFCQGIAAGKARFNADWVRASNMVVEVDEATRTAAGCIRFYLKYVVIGGAGGRSWKPCASSGTGSAAKPGNPTVTGTAAVNSRSNALFLN